MPVRTNVDGLLEILHPETGAYVPASVLLQVENGLLASLVPEQVALLSDICDATAYLKNMTGVLNDLLAELASVSNKQSQSNVFLNSLTAIDTALGVVKQAIDGLESLESDANALLAAIKSEIALLSGKLPSSLGAKIRDSSLSVALATDSTIFTSLTNLLAALTGSSGNSVYTALVSLSGQIPVSLGAKIRDSSLSVALATDSTIFASLNSILSSLSSDSNNNVYNSLTSLSAKIPASLGTKLRTESLSVALATDSTIFASLTSILGALSDGGSNSALSYLSTVAGAQFWKNPTKFNTTLPIINAATTANSSSAYTINSQTTGLSLQNFFSATGLSAQFVVELRVTTGATSLSDKQYYYRGDVASPYIASAGAYPGESPIVVPTHGFVQAVVHLSAITGGGNVTTYAKEIR